MKYFISLLIICTFWAQFIYAKPIPPKVKYLLPDECLTGGHTCVLKVDDGRRFFCLRLVKERQRNARVKARTIRKRFCKKRFPAVPIEEKVQPPGN